MIKKVFALALAIALGTQCVFASPFAINKENLPKDEDFVQKLEAFENNYDSLRYYKNEYESSEIESAENLKTAIEKIKKPNYDVQVLKMLVLRCLYNADKVSGDEIDKLAISLDKKYKNEAAHLWVYANYLSTTNDCAKALNVAKLYLAKNPDFQEPFLFDLCYIFHMCGMRLNAESVLKTLAEDVQKPVSELPYYNLCENGIEETKSCAGMDAKSVWLLNPTIDYQGYGYLDSSMLGMSFPVKSNWKLKYNGFENGLAAAVIGPDPVKTKIGNIGFNIVVVAIPEEMKKAPFDTFIESTVKKMNGVKGASKIYGKNTWDFYTYENPNVYNDERKGQKGYILTGKISPSAESGLKCEHAVDLKQLVANSQSEGNEPRYFNLGKTYRRLPEDVEVLILVDSCNLIDKDVQAFLDDFMRNKAVFE